MGDYWADHNAGKTLPSDEKYLKGVRSFGATQATNERMGGKTTPKDQWQSGAHAYGMGYYGEVGRKKAYGPPQVSQDQFQNALGTAYETKRAGLTPEVVEAKKREAVSYMSAQAANDYGTHKRAMDAHRGKYGQ